MLFVALMAVLLLLSGCTTEGFCITNCEGQGYGSGGTSSGLPDGGGGIILPGSGGCQGLGCQAGGTGSGGTPITTPP